jgi:hypothetical protein
MKTVRDIFPDALAMKRVGLLPHAIADRLVEIGHDNDFAFITERGAPDLVELTFESTGEIIRFAGSDWHHVKP